jgi:ABC-type nickel/cobalt efflux system permease component RcnA
MIRWLSLALAVLLVLFTAGHSFAQQAEPKRNPFGGPAAVQTMPGSPAPAAAQGPLDRAWLWIMQTQQQLNRDLAAAVRGLKSASPLTAAAILAALSFAYGVLHAAGPGHGKAVISAYVLANERTVRRGILLSFMAAGVQAMSAIVMVGVLAVLMKATSLEMRAAEQWIETISWGLVAAVGAWLLWNQLRPLMQRRAAPIGSGHGHHGQAHAHAHAHGHGHESGCCGHGHRHEHHHKCTGGHDHEHHHHHHHHHAAAHEDGAACCGHAHMPAPKDLEGPWSWKNAFALAFSVGIRPCTGAILVLVFALGQGLFWAGVFSAFAMAIGTAITVSALAAMAVGSRELARRLAGRDSPWSSRIATAAGITGSALVLLMGATFFFASLNGSGPL